MRERVCNHNRGAASVRFAAVALPISPAGAYRTEIIVAYVQPMSFDNCERSMTVIVNRELQALFLGSAALTSLKP